MYVCQEFRDLTLFEIANFFELSNPNSAGKSICQIRNYIRSGKMKRELNELGEYLELVVVS
jgi:hypothetical protein